MDGIEGYETAAQAAQRLGVDERQVRHLASEARLPGAVKMSGVWLVPVGSWPKDVGEGGPGRPPKWKRNGNGTEEE